MDNEEPIFGKTTSSCLYDRQQRGMLLLPGDHNPHQALAPSQFRGRDLYQSTYSLDHRPFAREERLANEHWVKERRTRPWLQEPVTDFKLQHRDPTCVADNRIYPNDAQLATLPHYVDPQVRTGRSEVQASFSNPYKAKDFYFEEPNKLGSRPPPAHLLKTFVN